MTVPVLVGPTAAGNLRLFPGGTPLPLVATASAVVMCSNTTRSAGKSATGAPSTATTAR